MFNVIPAVLATGMASIDVISLGLMKDYTLGKLSPKYIILGIVLYALQPLFFLKSLEYETMTVMNILWDLISDILVTASGLLYFKEKLSPIKQLALVFAFISIVLFSYDDMSPQSFSKK
jgi:drug/metabolite transporter (DMT)-like permease